jgi:hypothetical protein
VNELTLAQHTQAPIMVDNEVAFSVDEKLQSLIQFYYDHGFLTFSSCENSLDGSCWIKYELSDWIEIAESSFSRDEQALYHFIDENCKVDLLSEDDGGPDENDEYWIPGNNLIWSATVSFKKELLPTFEKLVRSTFG